MATKSENADIAVLQTQMETVTSDMSDVKIDVKKILDKLDDSYVKKSEFRAFKWMTIPVTVIVTVVLTFLVTYFLQNISNPTTATPTTSSPTTITPTGSSSGAESSKTTRTQDATTGDPPEGQDSTPGGEQLDIPKLTP